MSPSGRALGGGARQAEADAMAGAVTAHGVGCLRLIFTQRQAFGAVSIPPR